MPLARRLSNSSQEAFTDFCSKNQPLSRRLSSNGDAASISSTSRRESITQDRGQRLLKRRVMNTSNHNRNPSKAHSTRSSLQKDQQIVDRNISSPEPKKQRTSPNKENGRGDSNNVECLMMSPTPYWKVSRSYNQSSKIFDFDTMPCFPFLFTQYQYFSNHSILKTERLPENAEKNILLV